MNLKEARKKSGLMIAEAAKEIGATENMIKGWENGSAPTPRIFKLACKVYGVNPREVIVTGKNDQDPLTLAGARYNAGYSQDEAANDIGVSYGTLAAMEYGTCLISDVQKAALCELYGIKVDDIIWPRDKKKEEDKSVKRENVAVIPEDTTGQYEWEPGAPEITEQDRMVMDLACAQEEAERYRLLYNAAEERVAELEKEQIDREDVIRQALEVATEREQEIRRLRDINEVLRRDNDFLDHAIIEVKAECYDLLRGRDPF